MIRVYVAALACVLPSLAYAQDAPPESAEAPPESAEAPQQPAPAPADGDTRIYVPGVHVTDATDAEVSEVAPSAPEETSPAWRSNRYFQTQIGPVVLASTRAGDSWGFGLEAGLRYGLKIKRFIFAPGVRLGAYTQAQRYIGDLLLTDRITVPIGMVAPFIEGGIGPGGMTNPGTGGIGVMLGGGVMLHFSTAFALGVRGSYEAITSTRFRVVSFGPMLQFGF